MIISDFMKSKLLLSHSSRYSCQKIYTSGLNVSVFTAVQGKTGILVKNKPANATIPYQICVVTNFEVNGQY